MTDDEIREALALADRLPSYPGYRAHFTVGKLAQELLDARALLREALADTRRQHEIELFGERYWERRAREFLDDA